MPSNLIAIAQTAIQAAQAGLNTTGHNIANASTPGYNRQQVIQASAAAQNAGYGFVGGGTKIGEIKRVYNEFLSNQVVSAQTNYSSLDSYYSQIRQVDNLLADTASGLSPALQDFFKGVQDLASNPASVASRQAILSTADSLAARFQGMDNRLSEIREGVDSQITSSVSVINSYATQIGKLNESIALLASDQFKPPNDLMDQRDQLVAELNKEVKATVVKQSDETYTVSIGNGQPLVVGGSVFQLAATKSATDLNRVEVGYLINGNVSTLPEDALTGGKMGGLFQFRTQTLDVAQNSLGRIALGLATTFNAQHQLGQDLNGNLGGNFFNTSTPVVTPSILNIGNAGLTATVTDATKLTTSDYQLQFDGTNYALTRLSDNKILSNTDLAAATAAAQTDGFSLNLVAGSIPTARGDNFLIRPTIDGAKLFSVAITDRSTIAAAAPIATTNGTTNKGTGKISPGVVDASYLPANGGTPLVSPNVVTLTYDATANTLSGFPPTQDVTVTINGVPTVNTAPVASIPYTAGAKISFGGINIDFTGQPGAGDTFTIAQNLSGVGDNRNARLLGALQTATVLEKGTATYQGAYAEMVGLVGNKAREIQVNTDASSAFLQQAKDVEQAQAGVNLDEEAANLMRYQQAYQAAGKVMQIAGQLFDTLIAAAGR
ncbi:MAG: flagellar hook-associated protein FlgK [Burkholderiales bacterium]|nr:flagellar hook-associated protein FlgK [Burkholderiales bacterium]